MDLLITVSNAQSGNILKSLLRACIRRDCEWQVFITHEGVKALQDPRLTELLESYKHNAIACHDSWQRHCINSTCPVTVGSQTNHSEMASRAKRLISL